MIGTYHERRSAAMLRGGWHGDSDTHADRGRAKGSQIMHLAWHRQGRTPITGTLPLARLHSDCILQDACTHTGRLRKASAGAAAPRERRALIAGQLFVNLAG